MGSVERFALERRQLHPYAWWVWALGIAGAVSMSTNPYILALAWAVICFVVAARRGSSPWAKAFKIYVFLAAWIVVYRVVMHICVGAKIGSTPLFTLPPLRLPQWAAGINVFGTVYFEGLIMSAIQGLALGTMIVAVGAANSLSNPKRLIKALPSALGDIATVLVIGLSIAPHMAEAGLRIYRARALRGDGVRGVRGFARILLPIFQDTLERSLALAASMDARGYGRVTRVSLRMQRVSSGFGALGVVGASVGVFVLLDASAPLFVSVPILIVGVGFLVISLGMASKRKTATTYDPQPFRAAEWLTCMCGLLPLAAAFVSRKLDPGAMVVSWIPLHIPNTIPLVLAVALVWAAMPGFLTPRLPVGSVRVFRRRRA